MARANGTWGWAGQKAETAHFLESIVLCSGVQIDVQL